MPPRQFFLTGCLFLLAMSGCSLTTAAPPDGNRLAYLDEVNPYYPHRGFPKLTTPQWVGEPGVEAVVVPAIDDMREPARYEAYLRPIVNRLKAIDGRAPVSIMTDQVKPDDPQLQSWLKEGLSLEIHTLTHPCPLLAKGDFAEAARTYHGCVHLMNKVPGNTPVAFRMPCCDSMNTVSPRFFAEIFNKTSPGGKFLSIDSSVFTVLTPDDPSLPRDLVSRSGRQGAVSEVHPVPVVRQHDRELPVSLRDWQDVLGVSLHRPQRLGRAEHPQAGQSPDARRHEGRGSIAW